MKKPLEALLRDACERATKGGELLTTTLPPLLLTVPKEPEHGDLASNLALVLARLLAAPGHDVAREYYVNDAGNQIAMLGASTYARYAERCGRAVPFPEDGYRGDYVREVAAAILAREGERLMQLDPAEASTYF